MAISENRLPDRADLSNLPPYLWNVLACMSDGMSGPQIAKKLGYKNPRTANSLVSQIYEKLGLGQVKSRTEKRTVAINVFNRYATKIITIPGQSTLQHVLYSKTVPLDGQLNRIKALLKQGYELDTVEIRFRKRSPY